MYYYPLSDIQVWAQDSAVVMISLGSGTPNTEGCRTSEGIGIGGHMTDKIVKAYGNPDAEMTMFANAKFVVYNARGVRALVNTQHEVLLLDLFAPGMFCKLNSDLAAIGWHGADCKKLTPPLE